MEAGQEHPLQHSWTAWEHRKGASATGDYGSNMMKICTFNTVEGFWRFMNFTPCPSEMFTTDVAGVTKFTREVEGISVFKKDVRPEWEDPKNMHGGEFFVRKTMTPNQLDQFWEDLLLGSVGETIDPTNVITGVRVVDKSSKGKVLYRLEIWFECNQEQDPQQVELIKENIVQALGAPQLKFEYKAHSAAMEPHGPGMFRDSGRFHGGGRRG